jgi:gluconolactonase
MNSREAARKRDIRLAMVLLIVAVVALFANLARGVGEQGPPTTPRVYAGRVVRLDPRFDGLVPDGAALERIATGFGGTTGAVWDRADGSLLFSDTRQNSVFEWSERAGIRFFMNPSGYIGAAPFPGREPGSSGLAFDAEGRLVLCEHGDRRIARLEADGTKTTMVDRYQGHRLNSPHDLVFSSTGDLYFTDPPFGLPKGFDDPGRELPFSGVYRLSHGQLTLLTSALRAPSGIALSPSERTLYVSNVEGAHVIWMAYELDAQGRLGIGRIIFDIPSPTKTRQGLPGGIKVDGEGNVFAAGPGGIHVLAPDGSHLGNIELGDSVSNLGWGDDGFTLYVTAGSALYRIALTTRGFGF